MVEAFLSHCYVELHRDGGDGDDFDNIRSLRFRDSDGFSPPSATDLTQLSQVCHRLKTLTIPTANLTSPSLTSVLRSNGSTLTYINLSRTLVTDDDVCMLSTTCTAVLKLKLAWCRCVTDRMYEHLCSYGPQLLSLDVSGTATTDGGLQTLADSCVRIRELFLSWCRSVTSTGIAAVCSQCLKLRELSLRDCPSVVSLPLQLRALTSLKHLSFTSAMLTFPPSPILASGLKGIVSYLNDYAEDALPLSMLKLMYVGRAFAGKSSVADALKAYGTQGDSAFAKPRRARAVGDRTMGVDVSWWRCKSGIDLSCWDMAGQEDYYATHTFYLSDRSLYLLVFNLLEGSADSSEWTHLIRWVQCINARAPGARLLLVGTHLDKTSGDDQAKDILAAAREHVQAWIDVEVERPESELQALQEDFDGGGGGGGGGSGSRAASTGSGSVSVSSGGTPTVVSPKPLPPNRRRMSRMGSVGSSVLYEEMDLTDGLQDPLASPLPSLSTPGPAVSSLPGSTRRRWLASTAHLASAIASRLHLRMQIVGSVAVSCTTGDGIRELLDVITTAAFSDEHFPHVGARVPRKYLDLMGLIQDVVPGALEGLGRGVGSGAGAGAGGGGGGGGGGGTSASSPTGSRTKPTSDASDSLSLSPGSPPTLSTPTDKVYLHPSTARLLKLPFLTWDKFMELAAPCGFSTSAQLQRAVQFLHDLGVVVFHCPSRDSRKDIDADDPVSGEFEFPDTPTGGRPDLDNAVVFLDPQWIIDVMKRLISHNYTPEPINAGWCLRCDTQLSKWRLKRRRTCGRCQRSFCDAHCRQKAEVRTQGRRQLMTVCDDCVSSLTRLQETEALLSSLNRCAARRRQSGPDRLQVARATSHGSADSSGEGGTSTSGTAPYLAKDWDTDMQLLVTRGVVSRRLLFRHLWAEFPSDVHEALLQLMIDASLVARIPSGPMVGGGSGTVRRRQRRQSLVVPRSSRPTGSPTGSPRDNRHRDGDKYGGTFFLKGLATSLPMGGPLRSTSTPLSHAEHKLDDDDDSGGARGGVDETKLDDRDRDGGSDTPTQTKARAPSRATPSSSSDVFLVPCLLRNLALHGTTADGDAPASDAGFPALELQDPSSAVVVDWLPVGHGPFTVLRRRFRYRYLPVGYFSRLQAQWYSSEWAQELSSYSATSVLLVPRVSRGPSEAGLERVSVAVHANEHDDWFLDVVAWHSGRHDVDGLSWELMGRVLHSVRKLHLEFWPGLGVLELVPCPHCVDDVSSGGGTSGTGAGSGSGAGVGGSGLSSTRRDSRTPANIAVSVEAEGSVELFPRRQLQKLLADGVNVVRCPRSASHECQPTKMVHPSEMSLYKPPDTAMTPMPVSSDWTVPCVAQLGVLDTTTGGLVSVATGFFVHHAGLLITAAHFVVTEPTPTAPGKLKVAPEIPHHRILVGTGTVGGSAQWRYFASVVTPPGDMAPAGGPFIDAAVLRVESEVTVSPPSFSGFFRRPPVFQCAEGHVVPLSDDALTRHKAPDGRTVFVHSHEDGSKALARALRNQYHVDLERAISLDTSKPLVVVESVLRLGDSSSLRMGQDVFSIAYPRIVGAGSSVVCMCDRRIVSSFSDSDDRINRMDAKGCIWTRALVDTGSSGGPALDAAGNVVGVQIRSTDPDSPSYIGYLRGINLVLPVVVDACRRVGVAWPPSL